MTYSISQISNVVRTYNQQLKVQPAPLPQSPSPTQTLHREDQVSISPEGRRLLEAAEGRGGKIGSFSRQIARKGV